MNEFLNYEILGLITVQTYLIVAFIDLILGLGFSKKGSKASPLHVCIAKALLWPIHLAALSLLFAAVIVVFVFAAIMKLYRSI